MKLLNELLTYRRPSRSETEEEFIAKFIDTIPGIYEDDFGNRLKVSQTSRVMIACHTDSVHRMSGRQKIQQSHGVISLRDNISNCLGADDAAGIYAALKMINAGVDATYVFHREEEIGGNGSEWLRQNYSGWLAQFDICLSLDRRGKKDIITHQWGGRCCSDTFAASLADALGMGHKDNSGTFTDSANYADIIPECSNLSVGYDREHTPYETLDVNYLETVINRLINLDWDELAVCRDPEIDNWMENVYLWSDEEIKESGVLNNIDDDEELAYYRTMSRTSFDGRKNYLL